MFRYILNSLLPWSEELAKFRARLEGFLCKFSPELAPHADRLATVK